MYASATTSGLPPPIVIRPGMRVFVFLGHDFGAGWSSGALPGINEQRPYGYYHATEYGCTIKYSTDAEEARVMRFLRLSLRRTIGFDLLHAWRNRRDLLDSDVVWTHTELEHLAALALWRMSRSRRPTLIAQCIWLFDKWHRLSPPKRWLYKRLLARTDLLTVQSTESLKVAQRVLPSVRSCLNHYGTTVEAMIPAVHRPVHRPIRILSLGRDMHRDWVTVVTALRGWDACQARIGAPLIDRRLTRNATNIELVRPKSADLPGLYQWADLAVVTLKPNLHVSGITVVTEAMLMGLPVICTDTGGLRSYFSEEEVMYVQPNDADAVRNGIMRLAQDGALRLGLAQNAQKRLTEADLSTRARARRMAQISAELLAAKQDYAFETKRGMPIDL